MSKNRVETEILGKTFKIQSEDDEQHIKEVINLVNKHISEIKEHYPLADPLKIAILASLNLADELIKKIKFEPFNIYTKNETDEINKITNELITKLESSLIE